MLKSTCEQKNETEEVCSTTYIDFRTSNDAALFFVLRISTAVRHLIRRIKGKVLIILVLKKRATMLPFFYVVVIFRFCPS